MKTDNITHVLGLLIRQLEIPVTLQSVKNEIFKHPDSLNLLAISEIISTWNIPNAAYELTFDELMAAEIDGPFIAFYLKGAKGFILVNELNQQTVTLSDKQWNKHVVSIEEFSSNYLGSVLIAEKDAESGEKKYNSKRRKEWLEESRTPFLLSSCVIILLGLLCANPSFTTAISWQIICLALFKTSGLIVSVLLLLQSIDNTNPLIQRFCGTDITQNCNAILLSKAAKVNDYLSWSEVGFFYFAGTWMVLIFNANNSNIVRLLAYLNIISLPYTFYSIYYQWRVAKQWCIFCCTVQGLLWLEFFAFFTYLSAPIHLLALNQYGQMLIELFLPVIIWVYVKPLLINAQQTPIIKEQLQKFKYNVGNFNKLLNDGVKYALPSDENSIVLGNREAELVVTLVSSPFCGSCAVAHNDLEGLLTSRDDVKFQIVFNSPSTELDPQKKDMVEHLFSLQKNADDVSLKQAVTDWYNGGRKNYSEWLKNHPVQKNEFSQEMDKQREWCDMVDIIGTPTILINGRKLPKPYRSVDIRYLL